jgi:Flp pilus assembly protein TadG
MKTAKKRVIHRVSASRHEENGSALIEFSAFAFLFFVFAILAVHMSVVLYGAYFNDKACRDAARAAAQGTDSTSAAKLAASVLKAHSTNNTFLQSPTLGAINYQDFGGSPPALTSPYVQVTTTTIANLPFRPLCFMGAGTILQDGTIPFTETYTFPIVKAKTTSP